MPESSAQNYDSPSFPGIGIPLGMNRVDKPHPGPGVALPASSAADPSMAAEPAAAIEAGSNQTTSQEIRLQAAQLADHLSQQQQQLDHREAQLNAKLAEMDGANRAARLWISDRAAELDHREEELSQRTAEMVRQHVENQQEPPRPAAPKSQPNHRKGEEANQHLAEVLRKGQQLNDQLQEALSKVEQEGRMQRQRMALEQRETLENLERQRQSVSRRGQYVDQCREALEKLRTQVSQMHRETLANRLAVEELWTQLSGIAPPAMLTQSLAEIRIKQSEYFHATETELQNRQQELYSLCDELAERHQQLRQGKQQFDQWTSTRRGEREQQASRLIAREDQLRAREHELDAASYRWQRERVQLQSELARLQR